LYKSYQRLFGGVVGVGLVTLESADDLSKKERALLDEQLFVETQKKCLEKPSDC